MRKNNKKIPLGYISKSDYPIGQLGGCSMNSFQPQGMYQSGPQTGGNPLAVLLGIGSALKYVQPFSKAKHLLETNVSDKGKQSKLYKVVHGISNVGSSFGFGQSAQILPPIRYSDFSSQPVTDNIYVTRKKHTKSKKPKSTVGGKKRKTKKKSKK